MFSLVSLNPETALLLVLVLLLTLLVQQQNKKIHASEKQLRILKSDFQALLLCSRGVGDRLNWQQREFRNLVERQDRLEL
ncbi:MAG: hypothetical protein R3318_03160, partial [Gammaproteobacteria bacterium]|nr:hypothetical protein [Gammaproteobacteria bacterium]